MSTLSVQSITGVSSFDFSNTSFASAYGVANSGYVVANAGFTIANAAFTYGNSSYTVANAAFGKANTALQNTSGVFAGNLYFPSGNRIGIGTTTPNSAIHLSSSSRTYMSITANSKDWLIDHRGTFDSGSNALAFTYDGTEYMRISNDGMIRAGTTIIRSPHYTQSFSVGTTQWIRLLTIESPSYVKIGYMLGSNNSEENGDIILNLTYTAAHNRIEIIRQTYNSHLLEVRVTGSPGGPWTVFLNVRSSDFAPTIRWNISDLKSYNLTYTVHNDATTPGAAATSVTLENGGSISRITATNGTVSGINFLATQIASSDANTLDDYEEGTFTGTLNMHSNYADTSTTNTTLNSTGYYTKVGDLVYFTIYYDVTGYSNYVAKSISGMPFAAKNVTEQSFSMGHVRGIRFVYSTTISSSMILSASMAGGATSVGLQASSTAQAFSGWWYISNESGQGKYIQVSGTYKVL